MKKIVLFLLVVFYGARSFGQSYTPPGPVDVDTGFSAHVNHVFGLLEYRQSKQIIIE